MKALLKQAVLLPFIMVFTVSIIPGNGFTGQQAGVATTSVYQNTRLIADMGGQASPYDSGRSASPNFESISRRTTSPSVNGLYAMICQDCTKFAPSVLSNPNIDGLAMRARWSTLEPKDGSFNWAELDSVISIAQTYHKKVSISVTPGIFSPSWLYNEGVQSIAFKWAYPYLMSYCTELRIPVPWDPVYERKWGAFITALGARYNGNPSVSQVKLTGVNGYSQETNLPYKANEVINGGQCTSYDYVQEWISRGYTRAKVEDAWQQFAADFNTAFPNTEFVGMFFRCAFPPIDAAGAIIPGAVCDRQVPTDLIEYGIAKYGRGRFAVQNNSWNSRFLAYPNYAAAVHTGYQQARQPEGTFLPAVILATNGHAKFLEVLQAQLVNPANQSAIALAHQRLNAN